MAISACMKGLVCDHVRMRAAGYVARPEGGGPYRVVLDDPWQDVSAVINDVIQSGRPLENREHTLVSIAGNRQEESAEIQAIAHRVRVLSKGQLSVVHVLADNWPLPRLYG